MTVDFNPGPRRLAWATSPEIAASSEDGSSPPVALIPIGAVEQHGPHLPLGVDIWLATAVALAVAETEPDVLVAEPMPFGSSAHHRAFRGTISLRPSTLITVLADVCRCIAEDGMIPIILNGHGGNRAPLQVAIAELGAAGIRAAGFSYFDLIAEEARTTLPDAATGTGHACALETSLMMALFAEAVRASRIPAGGTPPSWPDPHLYAASPVTVWRGFEEINPTGVIGKPSEASATAGEALFAAAVQRSAQAVHRLRQSWGQFSSRHD